MHNPKRIFNNCGPAKGVHDPPPALNNTTTDKNKTMHIGINNTKENRDNFSSKVIMFALETRVVVDILF